MTRTVIFDIDGTLADATHRLHHVTKEPKNYDAFFAAVGDDPVIEPIRELAQVLARQDYKIILVSGRSDKVREQTLDWLGRHEVPCDELHMRREGDYRQDFTIKSEILDELLADGNEIAFVVDDRPSVVAMWRERGLTCLQCRDWDEAPHVNPGLLTVMVGPSGAGKSYWLTTDEACGFGIDPSHIVSSDQLRADLCGDFRDQTKNDEVFTALHAVVKTRLAHGLPTVVDATNLRRKDRLSVVGLSAGMVRYVVIDRPTEDKRRDAGWRATLPFDLIAKHDQTFRSQLRDILAGDGQPNVEVLDLRRAA
ncbi:AAA family ATPase [Fimbriiglobus ruber]|uniref:3'-phosphatase, 5'-polynucleotide kinase, phage-associated n=1 Tax=Fimbriiglobus ruber TaxID=1908690 RepID=A0A225DTX8_9BACT|nr:AAA family ATPase [Fimbriiglobus ruber]OWK41998.1 3'-phosphatase, 5'-polynucleotide kinase, phage-associated [Fimbriiglobus ruber]